MKADRHRGLSAPPNANAETQRLQTQIPQTQIPCETSLANATQTQVGKRKTQRLGANATPKQSKRNDSVRDIPRKRNPNASGANAAMAKANANANAGQTLRGGTLSYELSSILPH